jgi:hypothetical protein
MTISSSSGGNTSGVIRPAKFRFSSTSVSYDQQESRTRNNSTVTDRKGSELLNTEQLKTNRISNGSIRAQQRFLLEQSKQKNTLKMNNSYA